MADDLAQLNRDNLLKMVQGPAEPARKGWDRWAGVVAIAFCLFGGLSTLARGLETPTFFQLDAKDMCMIVHAQVNDLFMFAGGILILGILRAAEIVREQKSIQRRIAAIGELLGRQDRAE